MLKENNPDVAFFMETKLHSSKMEKVRRAWGMVEGIDVSSDCTRDGLSLGWRQCVKVVLRSFSMNHVDVLIEEAMEDTW